jgi:hypothetical protein
MQPARYGLRGENRKVALARLERLDGFFVGRESAFDAHESPSEEPATVRVVLHGIDWLDALADRPKRTFALGDAVLEVNDATGRVLGDYPLWDASLTVAGAAPEGELTARLDTLPHAGAEWAWDQWRQGRPKQQHVWAAMPVGEREGWLEVARIVAFREHKTPYPVLTERMELDGRHVDDLASLFCALGEAVDGPGGFCADSPAGLADCLRHAPRTVPRPKLEWRELPVAEKGLARTVDGSRYLDLVLSLLNDGGIEVAPA